MGICVWGEVYHFPKNRLREMSHGETAEGNMRSLATWVRMFEFKKPFFMLCFLKLTLCHVCALLFNH